MNIISIILPPPPIETIATFVQVCLLRLEKDEGGK